MGPEFRGHIPPAAAAGAPGGKAEREYREVLDDVTGRSDPDNRTDGGDDDNGEVSGTYKQR